MYPGAERRGMKKTEKNEAFAPKMKFITLTNVARYDTMIFHTVIVCPSMGS